MGVILIQMICPIILLISVGIPLYRGWNRVQWLKSVILGWAFFVGGCAFREWGSPWLAGVLIGESAQQQVQCANSYMLEGIAIGWIFPVLFHGMGLYWRSSWDQRKKRLS